MEQEEKAALQARGIGLTKTHVYLADGEEKNDPQRLAVSMSDYFAGDTFEAHAFELNAAVVDDELVYSEGDELTGTEGEESSGRIADSTARISGKEITYPLPENRSARVKITFAGSEQIIDITPSSKSAWIDWVNVEPTDPQP